MARKVSFQINPLLVAGLVYYFMLRPKMLKTGTLLDEAERHLPGDDLIMVPNFQSTHAINIDTPPDCVWPWIAQLGRAKTGFYGLDGLTNQGIPSAAYLREDLAAPKLGMVLDDRCRILDIQANQLFLYGGFDLTTLFGGPLERTTLIWLEARPDNSTRLLIRNRGFAYGPTGRIHNLIYEVIDFFHTTRQLANLRERAEVMVQLRAPLKA